MKFNLTIAYEFDYLRLYLGTSILVHAFLQLASTIFSYLLHLPLLPYAHCSNHDDSFYVFCLSSQTIYCVTTSSLIL